VIMIAMALITQLIGVNTVLGAFVAGILIGESPILTRHIDEQLRGLIVALFMPVFFGLSGLSADLTVLKNPALALLALGLIGIASVGKFLGAFVGGKLGGLTRAESLALGCGMNARGSTEVIVATIGLSMGVLNRDLFTLIVTMAIVTTMAMPPMLRWALKRLPMRRKERIRLEREELDAKSFVTNLERLLLAADDSANGKFASRLVGVIAGSGGKPTTIVDMSKDDRGRKAAAKTNGKEAKAKVETAAEGIDSLESHPDEEKPGNVDVISRSDKPKGSQAIAEEARKGYDLMVVGIAKTRGPNGGFSKDISLITNGFEGPLAVVDAHDSQRDRLPRRYGKILIPVNGTEVSRRAAEIGLTLARANDAQVTALFVTRANGSGGKANNAARKRATRRNERAILKDIGALGDRYEVDVRSTTRANLAPGDAIIREAKRGYDLVVLGVSRRPGETLFFGDTAASVLERSDTSNLFVAS
jgi:nucleotide-binding universal stress UspA family protein